MKKLISLMLCGMLCLSAAGCASGGPSASTPATLQQTAAESSAREVTQVTKTEREFEGMMKDLGKLPVTFIYNNTYYNGLGRFSEKSRTRTEEGGKVTYNVSLYLEESLSAGVVANFYREYDAWDYTVYFSNPSKTNSGVIRNVNDIDIEVQGANPVLKGNHGDHSSLFVPYEYDLTEKPVEFVSLKGRATHEECPYFNLEHDDGHTLLALGWGGTWQANFVYDAEKQTTHVTGNGTVGLETYLKPGETIRTSLVAVLRSEGKDEDKAMNKWRRWVIDCNMPRNDVGSEDPAQPFTSICLQWDTGRGFEGGGSIEEGYDSWKNSLDTFYKHGLTADYRWVDAGWYADPEGKTIPSAGDWWGAVGTWELDPVKWPGNTFRDSVDYAHAHGTKTLVWFEPERVTHIEAMVSKHGYKFNWALSDHGDNNNYLNNLGDPECLDWTTDRILTMMEENDVDMYREDHNIDPELFWNIGDGYQGSNRKGITENLYMQGHYELWDRIIAWCAAHGKTPFVDSCASGGGRNDLETLRRAIIAMRSDGDCSKMSICLAMTTRMSYWMPFGGRQAKEAKDDVHAGITDLYVMRVDYLPHISFCNEFYTKESEQYWDDMVQGLAEWKQVSKYLLSDFYVLTPQRESRDDKNWTAYMYFDPDENAGVLQAFRPVDCKESMLTVKLKGVDPDRYYTLRDADGKQNLPRIRGSALLRGIPLTAETARTALLFYIEPTK